LIRDAVSRDIPVLGHCLGGQLISKALGGIVSRNPVKEIGWNKATVSDNQTARAWFGATRSFEAFHWHGETFTLPTGATHLLSSAHCTNQAYALGKHLALQCHVEMTEPMIFDWCKVGLDEVATATDSPAVQPIPVIQKQIADNLPRLHEVARRLYQRWLTGLVVS
jgi:GMP synthase-like glutamine amidotransferase